MRTAPDERVNSILASVQRSDSAAAAAAAAADANGADDDQNADRKNIGKIFFTEARQRMDSDDWQVRNPQAAVRRTSLISFAHTLHMSHCRFSCRTSKSFNRIISRRIMFSIAGRTDFQN
jgi:hypothetical protein